MSSRSPEAQSGCGARALLPNKVLALALLALFPPLLLACAGGERAAQPAAPNNPAQPAPTTVSAQPAQQTTALEERRALRVCADPNNLPFSNRKLEGFENRIAELLGRELNLPVEYTWWAQRRGFVRNTLRAGLCDVLIGVPSSYELALTTAPYYRSTYAFIYRKSSNLTIRSFDDAILRSVKIGVQMIGDDSVNSPPAHALSNRHIIENVRGYNVYGDYTQPDPPARIVEAVARGEIDVAVAWGPMAGYFAKRQRVPLEVVPVSPEIDLPYLPFVFDVSVGVRRGETAFKEQLEEVLRRKRLEIERILDEYGVPRVGPSIRQTRQGREGGNG
jgi:mxaJ protein